MPNTAASTIKLKIDGSPLSPDVAKYLSSIEYVESFDALDMLIVQFTVPEGNDAPKVMAIAEKIGKKFDLELISGGKTRKGKGDILEISHSLGFCRPWTITLRGFESLHRVRKQPITKLWKVSHSKIAQSIAGNHGLSGDAQGVSDAPPFTLQAGVDDAVFLKRLAKLHNYYVNVEDGKLKFGRRNTPWAADVELTLGKEIDGFNLTATLYDIVTQVDVLGRDYTKPEIIKGKSTASDLKKISGGDTGAALFKKAFGDRKILLHHAQLQNTSSANELAKAELLERGQKFIFGQVDCGPVPQATSGGKLKIKGAHWPLTGPYLIRQTRHILEAGSGYRTIIEFVSDSYPSK